MLTFIFKMATNNNAITSDELRKAGSIQISVDSVPTKIADTIVPVIECNPKLLRRTDFIKTGNLADATTTTITTTPTDKDTFITNIVLSFIKDANATSTAVGVYATTDDGLSQYLIYLPCLTLTAQTQTISFELANPLKLKRGTGVSLVSATAVASISAKATIYGFQINDNI